MSVSIRHHIIPQGHIYWEGGAGGHAEHMSLYNFIILRKKQWTQMKIKQLKQDILNQ